MSFSGPTGVLCGHSETFDHGDSTGQAQHNMSLITLPYAEPLAQDPSMNHFAVADCSDQALNEFIVANFTNLGPIAHRWSDLHCPSTDDLLSEFEAFLMERPLSRSSAPSLGGLSDPTYVPSPSSEHRVPTPPFEFQLQQVGVIAPNLFFNADTDVLAKQEDLRNFARSPWADTVPDELLTALLDRVQLPKASRGKGARKGAQGYYCRWPQCTKTDMTIRLDHAKAHVSQHVGIKPFKCTECTRPFLRRADLKRHDKTCYARRVEV